MTVAELALAVGVTTVGAMLIIRAPALEHQQSALQAQLNEYGVRLENTNTRLRQESRRDALTGLGNRLALSEDAVEVTARAERYGQGFSLVLMDLDRFKDYNDRWGHQAGDLALERVADLLSRHARDGDRLYRYGGLELLLILPEQDRVTSGRIAERHLIGVRNAALPHPDNVPAGVVTFSAGVATGHPGEKFEETLARADKALSAAKADGRNRIRVAADPAVTPSELAVPKESRPQRRHAAHVLTVPGGDRAR